MCPVFFVFYRARDVDVEKIWIREFAIPNSESERILIEFYEVFFRAINFREIFSLWSARVEQFAIHDGWIGHHCRNHFIRVFQLKIAMWIPSEIFPTRTVSSDSLFREKGAFSARFKRPLVSSLREIFRWKGVPLRKLEKTTRRYLFSPFFCTGNIQPS